MRSRTGHFIVLEGIDGSGTTTQAGRVAAALRERGRTVVETHEPGSGPIGVEIRKLLKPEASPPAGLLPLLFAADRLEHLANVVKPALERGEVVICDRYTLSSLVYQGLEHAPAWILEINTHAISPSLTFLLDLPAEVALERVNARGGLAERFDRLEVQQRLRAGYLRCVGDRWPDRTPMVDHVILAGGPVESVTRAILSRLAGV